MSISDEFMEFVLGQLLQWGKVSARKMFGGAGLYRDGVMFGLIVDDIAYLKVDDSNRKDFERAGTEPFTFTEKGKTITMSYYEIPADVLEKPATRAQWAQRSFNIARKKRA